MGRGRAAPTGDFRLARNFRGRRSYLIVMKEICEVGIDNDGRLYVVPRGATFPFIYREAMGVTWNPERSALFSAPPREWTYLRWFEQIITAAREQGYQLTIASDTRWNNVPDHLRDEITAWTRSISRP
jgi:hypothetical protein